jgi:hypothetical protein
MEDYDFFLGRTVRNAATVSLKSEKLRRNFTETIMKLFYRAAIQTLVFDQATPGQYSTKKVKKVIGMSFRIYAEIMLKGSELAASINFE